MNQLFSRIRRSQNGSSLQKTDVIEEVNNYASFLKGYHRELNAVLGELSDNGKIVSMPSVIKSLFLLPFLGTIPVQYFVFY